MYVQHGVSLSSVCRLIRSTVGAATGLDLAAHNVRCKLHGKTVKRLGIGISTLDFNALIKSLQKAPYLLVAVDESTREGDKNFPHFVAFWDAETERPWWGLLRIATIEDKASEVQTYHDTIVGVLKFRRMLVRLILSDNIASVSSEEEGCVATLERNLRGDLHGACAPV